MSPARKPGTGVIPPTLEWVLNGTEDFRAALPAMMKFRKLSQEDLGWKMAKNGIARMIFSAFLRNTQKSLKLDSMFEAIDAMDLEVVVRRKSTPMAQRRLAALKAERDKGKKAEDEAVVQADYAAQGRDTQGKLLDVSTLTDQQRKEIDELLNSYTFS